MKPRCRLARGNILLYAAFIWPCKMKRPSSIHLYGVPCRDGGVAM
ncbi:hypothetical protein EBBID32_14490 [Sphingobium indicum BiD32]|uniref:Uncharacterized protein n=1 Tax=Sphingobium indicum BiD32 TaxID=1301087 RepID=N1MIQ8_9SPHN|nr:hypothetical protein EBBID32_14490 [Sphingobium indicum BiD32]